jgi:predicted ATPase
VRLLTLTGPGGTGKTRLALQVAAEALDDFEHGAFFISLAPLRDPALVIATLAQTLGVKESAGQPLLDSLKDALRDKSLLLVLDNFEQVLAAAPQVADLLAACPQVKVLVTSRAALHLYGEHEYPVSPLTLPDPQHRPLLESLSQYEAVRLFIERALAVKPDFAVTNANAPAVADICHRLDGLPLAIELAAARIRLLTPQAMRSRLGHRLPLLTGGACNLPARQQTLRNTIAWSDGLLAPEEQTLFRRLSVFVGGFTLEAAEAVVGDRGQGEDGAERLPTPDTRPLPPVADVLGGVDALVSQSLLQQEEVGGEPRIRMLETIREYALERLEERGEVGAMRRRHAAYFLALAERAEPELRGPQRRTWLDSLEREHDNLRAVLEWSLTGSGEGETGLRLAGALGDFWRYEDHLTEGRQWLERALEKGGDAPRARRAKALYGLGSIVFRQGDFAVARLSLEQSLAIYRELDDPRGAAHVVIQLGYVALNHENLGLARARFEESLVLYEEIGDRRGLANAFSGLAKVAYLQGDVVYTRACAEKGLALYRELGSKEDIASLCLMLGRISQEQGDLLSAHDLFAEGLALFRQLGDKDSIASSLLEMGRLAHEQGHCASARALYEESLPLCRRGIDRMAVLYSLGNLAASQGEYGAARSFYEEGLEIIRENKWGVWGILLGLGRVANLQGDYATARARYEESLSITRESGTKWGVTWSLKGLGAVAAAQGDYSTARTLIEQALSLLRELGSKPSIAYLLNSLGYIALKQGDDAATQSLFEESLRLSREMGDKQGIMGSLGGLGALALKRGDSTAAGMLNREGLALGQEMGSRWAIADTLDNLGGVAQRQGDYARGVARYRESLTLRVEMGDKRGIAGCLEAMAKTFGLQGQPARAARLFGAASSLRERIGAPLHPGILFSDMSQSDCIEHERDVAAVCTQLSEAAFSATWEEGRAMTMEQAVAYALREEA